MVLTVRPRHVRAFVRGLREKDLAPRSIRNIYGVLHRFFEDLAADEIVKINPCKLIRGDLPAIEDADSEWRKGARLSRNEAERLLAFPDVPADRVILYALSILAGLRMSESRALRFRHFDDTQPILAQLLVANSGSRRRTKTRVTRLVPVHPVLKILLDEWRLRGWPMNFGRAPRAGDLIVPRPDDLTQMRTSQWVWQQLQEDLDGLKVPRREFHGLRRTFIDMLIEAGVMAETIEYITHTPRKSMTNLYGIKSWRQLCEAVLSVEFRLLDSVSLRIRAQAGGDGNDPDGGDEPDDGRGPEHGPTSNHSGSRRATAGAHSEGVSVEPTSAEAGRIQDASSPPPRTRLLL